MEEDERLSTPSHGESESDESNSSMIEEKKRNSTRASQSVEARQSPDLVHDTPSDINCSTNGGAHAAPDR